MIKSLKKGFLIIFFLLLAPALQAGEVSLPALKIIITGLNTTETEQVRYNLSLYKAQTEPNFSQDRILTLHKIASQEIKDTLESLGYYHCIVNQDLKIKPEKEFQSLFHITPGPQTIISKVSFMIEGEAKTDPAVLDFLKSNPLKSGHPLDHAQYEHYKESLLSTVLQLGYLDALYTTSEIRIHRANATAEIILVLNTQKRYTLGEVIFAENPYPTEYMQRYVPFDSGTPYSVNNLMTFQKALNDSDLFSKVRIYPEVESSKDHCIPMRVKTTPKPRNRYTGSLGYGTDTGLRGQVGWEHRRYNYPGHKINANIKASKYINQANIQYSMPGLHPNHDRLSFGARIITERTRDDKYSQRTELNATYLKKEEHLQKFCSVQFIKEVDRDIPTDPKTRTYFLMPSAGFIWTEIEKGNYFDSGFRLNMTIRGATSFLLSSTNLLQAEARFKWAIPIADSTRLIVRGDLGSTLATDHQKIPLSLRFFAGGDHTVRGFGYQTIGPREPDRYGNLIVVGGRHLAVGSLEIEQHLYENWSGAIFIDTGNAMNKWSSRFSTGAGFGLRYLTPLGPLRLDIARSLAHGKHKPRVHLTFGIEF